MNLLTPFTGFSLLGIFAMLMIGLVYFCTQHHTTTESFLVADRNISWWRGSLSIAVSWIWAPAIFIASLKAFEQGIAGAFWFIIPNILCFFTFAPLAIRLRKLFPKGYTLSEFIKHRFPRNTKTHIVILIVLFGYQLGALVINAVAGGTLLHVLTGIPYVHAVLALSGIACVYSLMSGLRASIFTDVIQMGLILLVCIVLIPWVVINAGGISAITGGFGGVSGSFGNIFDPWIAYSFGIPVTLGLIAGPISDQMFFQRTFAVPAKDIKKTFFVGGIIFGIVPFILTILGFIAANPAFTSALNITDSQMVGPAVIAYFLPHWAVLLFTFMAFAGLCSTLDSAYCAISSLGSIDIFKTYISPEANRASLLNNARQWMVVFAVIGTGLALLKPQLLWVFLIYGALASAGLFPIVFSVFNKHISGNTIFFATLGSLVIGLPFSIYANITENIHMIVTSAILSIGIGLMVCLIGGHNSDQKKS